MLRHTHKMLMHTHKMLRHTHKMLRHRHKVLRHTHKMLRHKHQMLRLTHKMFRHTPKITTQRSKIFVARFLRGLFTHKTHKGEPVDTSALPQPWTQLRCQQYLKCRGGSSVATVQRLQPDCINVIVWLRVFNLVIWVDFTKEFLVLCLFTALFL